MTRTVDGALEVVPREGIGSNHVDLLILLE